MKLTQKIALIVTINLVMSSATIFGMQDDGQQVPIASVNGWLIYEEELYTELSLLEQQAITSGVELQAPLDYSNIETLTEHVIETMINKRLLLQECKRRNITVTQQEVDSNISLLENEFPSSSQFIELLQKNGITLSQLYIEIEEAFAIDHLASLILDEIQWESTEEEQESYYLKHLSLYTTPAEYQCRLIIFPNGISLKEADNIRNALAAGSSISIIKQNYSHYTDEFHEYSLDFLPIESYPPTMLKDIPELDIGEYTHVTELKQGHYGTFQLIEKTEKIQSPIHIVREQIIADLTAKNKEKVLSELTTQLKELAYIQRF